MRLQLDAGQLNRMICRCSILGILVISVIAAESRKSAPEPKISSIYPMTAMAGHAFTAIIRGTALAGAQSVVFRDVGFSARVISSTLEQTEASSAKPADLVQVEFSIPAEAKTGDHSFRLITAAGLTNELVLRSTNQQLFNETDVTGPLHQFPAIINGRLAKRGETDSYWLDLTEGQKLTFEVISGSPAFDPSLSIYEPSGSWFDADRLNRIAFNDEPLHFPGLASNPRLTYGFPKAGKYCLRVNAFSGQGGPDFVYELRITTGETAAPSLHPKHKDTWDERQFTRAVSAEWMQDIVRRSGTVVNIGRLRSIPRPQAIRRKSRSCLPPGSFRARFADQPKCTGSSSAWTSRKILLSISKRRTPLCRDSIPSCAFSNLAAPKLPPTFTPSSTTTACT